MHATQFYGLTELDPGDPITVDGASFSQENPSITDAILRIGAVTHRHDAHLPIPDPTGTASATMSTVGGTLAADTTVAVAYTLIDSDLGETRRSGAVQVTTPAGANGPQSPIVAAFDAAAGTLPVGQYVYAVTLNDAGGGETTLGPGAFVVRSPGYASGEMQLSGLDDEVDGAIYVSWNLWRMQDGGQFEIMVAAGTGDTFTDTGLVCTDAARQPPIDMSSVLATNLLTVTLPDAAQDPSVADAVTFGLYLSADGTFSNPCFYSQYPVASAGMPIDIPSLDLLQGEPPPVSRASVGANKINPDTDMLDFPWKRPVATADDLPTVGNTDGDTRIVRDVATLYEWSDDTSAWAPINSTGGAGSLELTDDTTDVTDVTKITFVGASVADDGSGATSVTIEGSGETLEVTDGTTDVTDVTKMTLTGATVTDDGSGSVTIAFASGGSEGPAGPDGAIGPTGPAGADGSSVYLLPPVASAGALPAASVETVFATCDFSGDADNANLTSHDPAADGVTWDFNANEYVAAGRLKTLTNRVGTDFGAAACSNYMDATPTNADVIVQWAVESTSAADQNAGVLARFNPASPGPPDNSTNAHTAGYFAYQTPTDIVISRLDFSIETVLASAAHAQVDDALLFFEVSGDTLSIRGDDKDTGPVLLTTTDSTYPGPGSIGLRSLGDGSQSMWIVNVKAWEVAPGEAIPEGAICLVMDTGKIWYFSDGAWAATT